VQVRGVSQEGQRYGDNTQLESVVSKGGKRTIRMTDELRGVTKQRSEDLIRDNSGKTVEKDGVGESGKKKKRGGKAVAVTLG